MRQARARSQSVHRIPTSRIVTIGRNVPLQRGGMTQLWQKSGKEEISAGIGARATVLKLLQKSTFSRKRFMPRGCPCGTPDRILNAHSKWNQPFAADDGSAGFVVPSGTPSLASLAGLPVSPCVTWTLLGESIRGFDRERSRLSKFDGLQKLPVPGKLAYA